MRELRLVEMLDAVRRQAGLEALHLPCIQLLRHDGWATRAALVGMLPALPPSAAPAAPDVGSAGVPPVWGEAAPSVTEVSDAAVSPVGSATLGRGRAVNGVHTVGVTPMEEDVQPVHGGPGAPVGTPPASARAADVAEPADGVVPPVIDGRAGPAHMSPVGTPPL